MRQRSLEGHLLRMLLTFTALGPERIPRQTVAGIRSSLAARAAVDGPIFARIQIQMEEIGG